MNEETLIDLPNTEALKLPGQQFDLRLDRTVTAGDSTDLTVYEQILGSQLEVFLPERYEQIRNYLVNDGYLSNEELAAILTDATTTQETIAEATRNLGTATDPVQRQLINDYLWELSQSITDRPLMDNLNTGSEYSVDESRQTLSVYEQMMGSQLQLLLPPEFEHIREPLLDNHLLDNEKIATALFNPATTFVEMEQLVVQLTPFESEATRNDLMSYFADLSLTVLDNPALRKIDPMANYDLVAIDVRNTEQEPIMSVSKMTLELPEKYEHLREIIQNSGLLDSQRVADAYFSGNLHRMDNAITDVVAINAGENQLPTDNYLILRNQLNDFLMEQSKIAGNNPSLSALKAASAYTPVDNTPKPDGTGPLVGTAMELNLPTRHEHLRGLLIERDIVNNRAFAKDLFDPKTDTDVLQKRIGLLTLNAPLKETADAKELVREIHQSLQQQRIEPKTGQETHTGGIIGAMALPVAGPEDKGDVKQRQKTDTPTRKVRVSDILRLKTLSGGFIANAVHNYQLLVKVLSANVERKENRQHNRPMASTITDKPVESTVTEIPTQPVRQQTARQTLSAPSSLLSKANPAQTIPALPLTPLQKAPIQTPVVQQMLPARKEGFFKKMVNSVVGTSSATNNGATKGPVQPTNQLINQQKMESTKLAPRWDFAQVESQLREFGITREILAKTGNLDELLNGRKTANVTINQTDKEGTVTPINGALYITEVPGRGPTVFIQPERQDIKMPTYFLGHELSDKDKQNLTKNGDMGRVAELRDKVTGDSFKAYIGFDKNTRSLTVMRQDRFYMPSVIKGASLSPKQQESLKAGKPTLVNGMKGADGQPFNAYVQISAAKRSLKFMRVPEQAKKQTQGQKQATKQENKVAERVEKTAKASPKTNKNKTAEQKPGEVKQTKTKQPNPKKAPELSEKTVTQGSDVKTTVSTVAKNGVSRTSVDKSQDVLTTDQKADPKQATTGEKANQGKEQITRLVNGREVGQKAVVTNKNAPVPEGVKAVKQQASNPRQKPKGVKVGR